MVLTKNFAFFFHAIFDVKRKQIKRKWMKLKYNDAAFVIKVRQIDKQVEKLSNDALYCFLGK